MDLTFTLNCSAQTSYEEGPHVPYKWQVETPPKFDYIIDAPERNISFTKEDIFDIEFSLNNWKWLSKPLKFTTKIEDPQVFIEEKTVTIHSIPI